MPQLDQRDIQTLGGLAAPSGGDPNAAARAGAPIADAGDRPGGAEVLALLSRARRRARGLAALRLASLAAAAALAGLLVGGLGAATFGRTTGLALLVASVLAVFVHDLRVHRHPLHAAALRRDPRPLARLLAGPGELLSSVELARKPPAGVSGELLDALHRRAGLQARALEPRAALPLRLARGPAWVLLAAVLALAAAILMVPGRLAAGRARLFSSAAQAAAELTPIAGDLSITYLYPAYTGLPPRTEEGTAGDLRAPRGTEVRLQARADRDLAQAFAVINGAPLRLQAEGDGHRKLSGTFVLDKPGQWSLRYADAKGRVRAEGPARPIEIVPDAPPQASIDAPTQRLLEVDPAGAVDIAWSASDDYGVAKVELVYQVGAAPEQRLPLQSPPAPAKRLRGTFRWELSPLHLRAGDRTTYRLEVHDADAVDGPQRGASATLALKVFSAAEHDRELLLRAQALWERLLAVLADRLEEPAPEGGDWFARTSRQDAAARKLTADLAQAGRELRRDKATRPAVGRALLYAAQSLAPLVQRTALARGPLAEGVTGREGVVRTLQAALAQEIREEEKDALYLQDLLDRARLDALQELGKDLAASRRELSRLAESLRKADSDEARKALLAEVARLRERIEELSQRMAELAKGIQDEHLNREAVASMQKEQDLLGQLSDVQRKLQAGKVDEALKALDRLGQQLDALEKNLAKKGAEAQGGRYSEEAQKLQQAAKRLSALKEREAELGRRTAAVRREIRRASEERFARAGGPQLAKELQKKVAAAKKGIAQVEPRVAEGLGLDEALDAAQGRVDELSRALESKSWDEALDQGQRALRASELLQARLQMESQVGQRYPGFSREPQAVQKGLAGTGQAVPALREVTKALEQALPRESDLLSPAQQKELAQEAAEQSKLARELGGVRQELQEVGRKAPIFGPQHERMLEEAQGAMGRAQEQLESREPRGAQAGEEQASERLNQFEQAMQKLAQQGGAKGSGGMPLPWGEPRGEGEGEEPGDSDSTSRERVQIPDAEASRGPAAFRKELLDHMKQAAPEKFRERVKGYYEELVK